MITLFYVNPLKPKPTQTALVLGTPPKTTTLTPTELNGHGANYNTFWAKKKGCTPQEFALRDMAFQTASKFLNFAINEAVYPCSWDDYVKMGKCRISKVFKTYADEDAKWPDKGAPHVIEVVAEGDNWALYTSTATFFSRLKPVDPETLKKPTEGTKC